MKLIINTQIRLFLIYIFLHSILLNQEKLNFSANSLETITEDNIEKQIFKNDVIIKKNTMQLFADNAIYQPDFNLVTLTNNVKMYDLDDSLFCDSLILYDEDYKKFKALNNVNFYQSTNIIECEHLEYESLSDSGNVIIQIFENAQIRDSLRTVKGDSIFINYKDSIINTIHVKSNGEIWNYRFAKIDSNASIQRIEDYITSKEIHINFNDTLVNTITLGGMAKTKLYAVKDTLIQGINESSGDSILINMDKNIITRMQITGGATGKFNPEKNNSKVDSTIIYKAEYIDYLVSKEISYLINNAYVNYDLTELNAGKIFIDWNKNYLEATIKDNIYPSINGFGESPTYGENMIFDLLTKRGTIYKGKTAYNQGYYEGENIFKEKNEVFYISNSQYTTCDNDNPHYYFLSKNMKMIPNDRIIAKPVTLYLHDLPFFSFPFAVFPNKNGNRISGWIMPSFGYRNSVGSYLENLGYYYVLNDYADYRILLNIQDQRGLFSNNLLRYKRRSGKNWYNYYLDGSFEFDKKYYLSDSDNDFSNLSKGNTQKISYIKWRHNQTFDPMQNLIIKYEYHSSHDPNEINLNKALDQNQTTSLSYYKRGENNSLSIGFSKFDDLFEAPPTKDNQILIYKWLSGPRLSFNLPHRKLFGNSNKWTNDIYISYSMQYNHGKEEFTKNSCLDQDSDGHCDCWDTLDIDSSCDNDIGINFDLDEDGNQDCYFENDQDCDKCITAENPDCQNCSEIEGTCQEYLCGELDDNDENGDGYCDKYIWKSNEEENIQTAGTRNNIQLSMTRSIGWLTISPRLNLNEDWVFKFKNYSDDGLFKEEDGFKRRFTWNSSLSLNTKIYGIIPINLGRVNALRHKITPQMTFNYTPDLKTGSNQIINLDSGEFDILGGSYANSLPSGRENIRFSLDNAFQMKIKNKEGEIDKIDFLNYYLTFNYDGKREEEFSIIDSKLSLKKPHGGEYLFIHMQHEVYDESVGSQNAKPYKFPKLKKMTAQMSTYYTLKGKSFDNMKFSSDTTTVDTTSINPYNTVLYIDDLKPKISNDEMWSSDLNFSVQGEYDVDDTKWDFNYFNLDTKTTIHLTKNWLLTYAIGINLVDMEIRSQSLKFYRDLHCWEFMFRWWPEGGNKGFQLRINVKHPDLQDIKVKSSSANQIYNNY